MFLRSTCLTAVIIITNARGIMETAGLVGGSGVTL